MRSSWPPNSVYFLFVLVFFVFSSSCNSAKSFSLLEPFGLPGYLIFCKIALINCDMRLQDPELSSRVFFSSHS
ncbi:hypothetical protein EDB81DRAFT_223233 [Dactylonectria macrodidyma]|uniref:Secreted protein n=1 Tax=Dactylonectria macrodidyma TaxID=307937 RepID=A0A9P9II55_9HYPO|nr:hypothetical protein EDB81DRAFT_223233 [Dactylonectria macrodidyma]